MTSKARPHTLIGLLLLIALVIGACDSQITDPETSILNKATERITEGAPAFEDQWGDGCLRWRDSEDFSAFRKTADQPDWPTCKEVREEQRKQKIETTFNALKAFYRATNGGEWWGGRTWDTTTVPTSMEAFTDWYGVTVEGGDLTSLDLNNNQLTGPIPPEIGNLTNLQGLYLTYNELTGTIPAEIGNLTNLYWLNLLHNQFTGNIPPEIGNLTNLEDLSLSGNELTGPIPPEIGNLTNLEDLWLGGNELTGTIPKEIGNLTNLEDLWLGGFNELTGPIPPEIGNLTNLTHLRLWGNELTGPIPAEIGNLTNLQGLHLHENQLTGTIPSEIGNLTILTDVGLHKNQLTGELPQGLVGAMAMDWLWFQANAGLCAPANTEFQTWLNGIRTVSGPTCSD